jgi:hypothetical protein
VIGLLLGGAGGYYFARRQGATPAATR